MLCQIMASDVIRKGVTTPLLFSEVKIPTFISGMICGVSGFNASYTQSYHYTVRGLSSHKDLKDKLSSLVEDEAM